MLILTRKAGETLVIGNNITVTVLKVQGGQVRIGVNAPKEVSVHREEIYERIQQEKGAPQRLQKTPPPTQNNLALKDTRLGEFSRERPTLKISPRGIHPH